MAPRKKTLQEKPKNKNKANAYIAGAGTVVEQEITSTCLML